MPDTGIPKDDELLRRAEEGDQAAFRTLVERYEGAVAATVIGMLGRGADADDVGQETFIRFYRSMHRYRGDASLKTYLTRIAINQSLKALKKRQRWRLRFVSRDDEDGVGEFRDPEARDVVGDRDRRELVEAALETLTPEHRSVVVLRMLDEYDTKETAAILGIPQGTVMSRLKRALEKLDGVLRPGL